MIEFEAFRVVIPFLRPLHTATAAVPQRQMVLVAVHDRGVAGWGEAAPWPGQTGGSVEEVWDDLFDPPGTVPGAGDPGRAAWEQARFDLTARLRHLPAWRMWSGTPEPVPATAAVGLAPSIEDLLAEVARLVGAGYRAVKLKIEPGRDTEPLSAVQREFPHLSVGVDANASYRELEPVTAVAEIGPAYIEQPFPPGDLASPRMLRRRTEVPVVADEAIWGVEDGQRMIEEQAADVITVKLGRLGIAAARRLLDWATEQQVPLKLSGLFETSVGRAHGLAFATRPEVHHVDFSPTAAHLAGDVVMDPFQLEEGAVRPRPGPGIGVSIDPAALDRYTVQRRRGRRPLEWPAQEGQVLEGREGSVEEMPSAGEDQ